MKEQTFESIECIIGVAGDHVYVWLTGGFSTLGGGCYISLSRNFIASCLFAFVLVKRIHEVDTDTEVMEMFPILVQEHVE